MCHVNNFINLLVETVVTSMNLKYHLSAKYIILSQVADYSLGSYDVGLIVSNASYMVAYRMTLVRYCFSYMQMQICYEP